MNAEMEKRLDQARGWAREAGSAGRIAETAPLGSIVKEKAKRRLRRLLPIDPGILRQPSPAEAS